MAQNQKDAGSLALPELEALLKAQEPVHIAQATALISQHLSIGGTATQAVTDTSGVWQGIESLSKLRATVGGRFENLKKRWVDAGFPLREHRGDTQKACKIDQDGWEELSAWLLKSGFESRLTPQHAEHMFEVRLVPHKVR